MRRCRSCDGILGVDCFNEDECMWISEQQERQKEQQIENEVYVQSERIAIMEAEMVELKNKITSLSEDRDDLIERVKDAEKEIKYLLKRE